MPHATRRGLPTHSGESSRTCSSCRLLLNGLCGWDTPGEPIVQGQRGQSQRERLCVRTCVEPEAAGMRRKWFAVERHVAPCQIDHFCTGGGILVVVLRRQGRQVGVVTALRVHLEVQAKAERGKQRGHVRGRWAGRAKGFAFGWVCCYLLVHAAPPSCSAHAARARLSLPITWRYVPICFCHFATG